MTGESLRALVVCEPAYHSASHSRLTAARNEGLEVHGKLALACAPEGVTLVRGGEATKARVEADVAGSHVIHFSGHGSPDAIFLAGSCEEEGAMTMSEVQALPLRSARLVVLSVCDSFRRDCRLPSCSRDIRPRAGHPGAPAEFRGCCAENE